MFFNIVEFFNELLCDYLCKYEPSGIVLADGFYSQWFPHEFIWHSYLQELPALCNSRHRNHEVLLPKERVISKPLDVHGPHVI